MNRSKKIAIPLALVLLYSAALGCGGVPAPGSVGQGGREVFPLSAHEDSLEILMGDVMPFYDDGVMNIYHLQQTRGTLSLYYHPISRLTTTDFVHYTDKGVAISYEESPMSPDAALGTGSFIKDEHGNYHCFYTGHNTDADSGLRYSEVVRHAVSYDGQETWTKDDDFLLYGNGVNTWENNDFRDPYVYYDPDDAKYYMLVTTRKDDCGIIKRYSSSSLDAVADEWADEGVFFKNDSGTYNMECPSYIEYNGFRYLMYSEQGENRVTHYRYQTEKNGSWIKPSYDYIDATGFYAGRLEKAGDKLYAFAWCAKLTGGSVGDFDWGGNLVAHEIKQFSDGSLAAVMPENVRNAFSTTVEYKDIHGEKIDGYTFKTGGDGFKAYAAQALSDKVTRIKFDVTANSYSGDFGLSFGLGGGYDNRLGSCVVAFDVKNSAVAIYNDVSNIVRYGSALATMPFVYSVGKTYGVEIIIDGEVFSVYVDGSVAVTGRCEGLASNNFAFYSNKADAAVKGITFYE